MKSVKLYSKDWCPFCTRAKTLLEHKKIPYQEINIEQDPNFAKNLFEKTGFRTVPQIFIGDECIGGFQELYELERKGELDKKLKES